MGYRGYRPMGDWDFFAHNIIITGWILTKILLDIDIDVFYLNTGRFFPRWLHLRRISIGFSIRCLLPFSFPITLIIYLYEVRMHG